jgi:WD40 repeat protein
VYAVAFSPDGARVVTGSGDATAKVWDASNGKLLSSLKGHQASVTAVAFSPDGERVVTASGDRTARLWDVHAEKRDRATLARLIRCRVPLHLVGDAVVSTPNPDRRDCDPVENSATP